MDDSSIKRRSPTFAEQHLGGYNVTELAAISAAISLKRIADRSREIPWRPQ